VKITYTTKRDATSEWRHKDIELAAHDLLQHLDRVSS